MIIFKSKKISQLEERIDELENSVNNLEKSKKDLSDSIADIDNSITRFESKFFSTIEHFNEEIEKYAKYIKHSMLEIKQLKEKLSSPLPPPPPKERDKESQTTKINFEENKSELRKKINHHIEDLLIDISKFVVESISNMAEKLVESHNKELIQIIEIMADVEHSRWASWQQYVFSQCDIKENGALIPPELVKGWQRQTEWEIDTSYSQLSEREKDSDRQEAKKTIKALEDNGFRIVNLMTIKELIKEEE